MFSSPKRAVALLAVGAGLIVAGCDTPAPTVSYTTPLSETEAPAGEATETPTATPTATATETPTPTPTPTEEPTEAPTEAATEPPAEGGGGTEVDVTTEEGLSFTTDALDAPAGTVTLKYTNNSGIPHDVRVRTTDGEDLGGTEQITEGDTTADVELESGEYEFYCSVPGHADSGMTGTLTVE